MAELTENEQLTEEFEVVKGFLPDHFYMKGTTKFPEIIPAFKKEPLSIPLTNDIVNELKSKSVSSSFGKGMETFHDENIRMSYELSSKQFDLNNVNLSSKESKLLNKIRQKLAPQCSYITCEPYKLLIYEKGCFFKQHRDSMKNDHHFATLILSIPYINSYENGQFYLSFDDQIIEWTPNQNNVENKCSWIAFYSDTKHEVKPITKGIRITITFNLMIPNNLEIKKEKTFVYSPYAYKIVGIIQKYLPQQIAWIILNLCGDCNIVNTISDLLKKGYHTRICMMSLHLYGGKKVFALNLKGRDWFLYQWLSESFNIQILPLLIRHLKRSDNRYGYDSDDGKEKIRFGRSYDYEKHQDCMDDETITEYQIDYGYDEFDSIDEVFGKYGGGNVYTLYNNQNITLSKSNESTGEYLGNGDCSYKYYQYDSFALVLSMKNKKK